MVDGNRQEGGNRHANTWLFEPTIIVNEGKVEAGQMIF